MTWWPLWERSPASRALRCLASARASTRASRRSAPGVWTTSSSPTSTWTPPTSMCATACPSRHRWRRWWPPQSPQTATVRYWDVTSATARARDSTQQFMGSLRDRGLHGVRLVISDAHRGLAAAADRWFQGAARQRCRVHFIGEPSVGGAPQPPAHGRRAVQNHLRSARRRRRHRSLGPGDRLAASFPKAGPLTDTARAEVLAFAGFPKAHWGEDLVHQPPRTHQQRDQAPLTRGGDPPDEASAIRLVGAILADLHDEWQASERRYLSEDSMSLLYPQRDSLATAELTAGN